MVSVALNIPHCLSCRSKLQHILFKVHEGPLERADKENKLRGEGEEPTPEERAGFWPLHGLRKSTQVMRNVFLFQWYTTESLWGPTGGKGSKQESPCRKQLEPRGAETCVWLRKTSWLKPKVLMDPLCPYDPWCVILGHSQSFWVIMSRIWPIWSEQFNVWPYDQCWGSEFHIQM